MENEEGYYSQSEICNVQFKERAGKNLPPIDIEKEDGEDRKYFVHSITGQLETDRVLLLLSKTSDPDVELYRYVLSDLNQAVHWLQYYHSVMPKKNKGEKWLKEKIHKLLIYNGYEPSLLNDPTFLPKVAIQDILSAEGSEKEALVKQYFLSYDVVYAKKYEKIEVFLSAMEEVNKEITTNSGSSESRKGRKRVLSELVEPGLSTVSQKGKKDFIRLTCTHEYDALRCVLKNAKDGPNNIYITKSDASPSLSVILFEKKDQEEPSAESAFLLDLILSSEKREEIANNYSTSKYYVYNSSLNNKPVKRTKL